MDKIVQPKTVKEIDSIKKSTRNKHVTSDITSDKCIKMWEYYPYKHMK